MSLPILPRASLIPFPFPHAAAHALVQANGRDLRKHDEPAQRLFCRDDAQGGAEGRTLRGGSLRNGARIGCLDLVKVGRGGERG